MGVIMFMATFTAYSEMRVRHKAASEQTDHRKGSQEDRNQLQLDRTTR
jgi:hypothetical protein